MNKRKFPPSFWDCEYKQPLPSQKHAHGNECRNNFAFPFTANSTFPSLLPSHTSLLPLRHSTNHHFYSFDRFASTFDPYSASCRFSGLQSNLQQALNAAAAVEAANSNVGNPWNNYAGLSSSLTAQNSYSHRPSALADFSGFSATSNYPLSHRYNPLLLQPSTAASFTANLPFHATSLGKSQNRGWPIQGYSGKYILSFEEYLFWQDW